MKVLLIHNFYQQPGGEDVVVAAETRLLRAHGHDVVEYLEDNHRIEDMNRLELAGTTTWSRKASRDLESLLRCERPSIVHFHNTFPLISPSAYYACAEAGVPVVQTLHNYRLVCPGATLLRDGSVCELCLGRKVSWPGVIHGCYRGSRAATAAVTAMLATHRAMRTWQTKVDLYIALSEFARRKFIEGGLPPECVVVKPNFVHSDPGSKSGRGEYALFVGRLSPEKGLAVLLEAWAKISNPVPLRIVGSGPSFERVGECIPQNRGAWVTMVGRLSPAEVLSTMRSARFVVAPSICYENFPLVVIEAYACGVPVIASRLGAMAEIVHDGRTGLHFTASDPDDLAAKVEWAWNHPEEMETMGRAARAEYEAKYTAERNYQMLLQIYKAVISRSRGNEIM